MTLGDVPAHGQLRAVVGVDGKVLPGNRGVVWQRRVDCRHELLTGCPQGLPIVTRHAELCRLWRSGFDTDNPCDVSIQCERHLSAPLARSWFWAQKPVLTDQFRSAPHDLPISLLVWRGSCGIGSPSEPLDRVG